MNFADRRTESIETKGAPAVVGIDPRYESLPGELRRGDSPAAGDAAEAFREFGCRVIDVVAPHVPAVKPNIAFFEALGWEGFRAYEAVVAHARERGLLVIADAKRGDIGSTAEAYARSLFETMRVDAVTLSPYLGLDSLAPFFDRLPDGRGVFILVKTSNPSAVDVQDLETEGAKVYERVADLVTRWGEAHVGESGLSSVGAVVGATYPEQAAELRERMPRTPFLLPGYGAQGGKAEALRRAFCAKGRGAVVNSSRGVIFAHAREPYASELPEDRWEEAVRRAVMDMRADLAGAVPDAAWNRSG
jgi:orotidine-5'-phosphate decarboxylase